MKFYLKLIFIIFILENSHQILNEMPIINGCPQINFMQSNVSAALINGTWYEIFKDESSFKPGKCVKVQIKGTSKNNLSVTYTQAFENSAIRSNHSVTKFNVKMIKSHLWTAEYQSLYVSLDGYFYILDTDYANYAVIVGCGKIRKISFDTASQFGHMVWILSRNQTLNDKYLMKAYETLRRNNLSIKTLRKIDQNCTDKEMQNKLQKFQGIGIKKYDLI
ncbi:hypothetical protein ACKWTF_000503 [Chironomus riparius]